jgi:23S rRNA (cytosine1962-C5)-methyltransferase
MQSSSQNKRPPKAAFVSNTSGLDYELIDSGNRRKLERFGTYILNRPELGAFWKPIKPKNDWQKADWYFFEEKGKKGVWKSQKNLPKEWTICYQHKGLKLKFKLALTGFKHIGIFPEQVENWQYMQHRLSKVKGEKRVLNLFAYTGSASLVAASCGALVTNVDSVKQVLNWGRENAQINKLDNIRWILEDARKYVEKALRRKEKYHGILLDPPAFGYGTKKEQWKLERDLPALLKNLSGLMTDKHSFFILNTYSPKLNLLQLAQMANLAFEDSPSFELSELGLSSKENKSLILGNLLRR